MASLISHTHYILIVGGAVISQHRTSAAAERMAKKERVQSRRDLGRLGDQLQLHIAEPGEIFTGHSWSDVPSVERA